ncbi:hypothetical protein PSTT_13201, partial [Puccinia striiformis]
ARTTSIKKEQARYSRQITSKSSGEGDAKPPFPEDQPSIDQMIFNLMTQILKKFKHIHTSSKVDQHAANDWNHPFPSKIEITMFDTASPTKQLHRAKKHA